MFNDEDEYFDREPEPEPLLIQAAGVLLVAVCVWLGVKS